jgi:hypothetical protein
MQCQKHKELLERWWNDRLTEAERGDLERQLSGCEDCQRELEGSRELWDLMSYMPVPEPSGEMQANFNTMLESYKASEGGKKKVGVGGLWQLFAVRPWAAAAFCAGLLFGGLGLGLVINKPRTVIVQAAAPMVTTNPAVEVKKPEAKIETVATTAKQDMGVSGAGERAGGEKSAEGKQLEALTAQVHEMREMMMLSLLQNPSASERIRAVSYTSDIRHVDPNIAAALLATLNGDPNINVRLSTLEALTHFARDPVVREGLVQSILQQDSPLMQAALADVMLRLQEKRAIQPFKKLLQQKDLNSMVRAKIEQTITQLT